MVLKEPSLSSGPIRRQPLYGLGFMVTIALPYPEFWAGQPAYVAVLGFTPRVVTASLVGYFWRVFQLYSLILLKS